MRYALMYVFNTTTKRALVYAVTVGIYGHTPSRSCTFDCVPGPIFVVIFLYNEEGTL